LATFHQIPYPLCLASEGIQGMNSKLLTDLFKTLLTVFHGF